MTYPTLCSVEFINIISFSPNSELERSTGELTVQGQPTHATDITYQSYFQNSTAVKYRCKGDTGSSTSVKSCLFDRCIPTMKSTSSNFHGLVTD